jgi:hypothetical protein
MKKNLITLAVMALTFIGVGAFAQTNTPTAASFIKGTLNITFNTHQNPPGTKGIQDVYDININVANSALFHGKMTDRPQIIDGWINKAVVQPRSLKYDVSCDIMNPKNTAQVKKDVSKLSGFVNIASSGEYNYNGSLGFSVLDRMAGSDSKFSGVAAGKPLGVRPANWLDTLQRQTINITRNVNGKTMTVALKKYDKMEFRSLVLAAGPIPLYSDATVNGEMLYDYDKNTWFFNNMSVNYSVTSASGENIIKSDRITGTIRWVEDENRKANGKGEYQFDVRVNEPLVNESAAFAASTTADESAFFSTDTSVPGLSGTMKYQDTLKGDTTLASAVAIDLVGNSITKQQLMILNKIIIFISVIPMNSD